MTDAGWMSGKNVREVGWYWWEEKGLPIKAVQIEKGFTFSKLGDIKREVMYVVGYGGFLEDKHGRFLGPIFPSTYHQGRVAGLREALEVSRGNRAGVIISLLNLRIAELEQQAQGGQQ